MSKTLAPFVAIAALLAVAGARAVPITVDGAADQFGMQPIVAYGLTENGDILPVGPNGFGLFGLFDTGSTGVFINDDGTNFFFANDDAANLGIAGTRTVDISLNGLGATTQDGPNNILTPIGAGAAQIQVPGVAVGPGDVDITLFGAPVANQIAALIDYTTPITRSLSAGSFSAPDITFMQSADTDAFAADVELELTPFGTDVEGPAGEDRGQRYYLRDVALNDGAASADGTGFDLFWDTGTNVTLISTEMAALLGLDLGMPDFTGLVGGQTLAGFSLDSIVMSGLGGDYTVLNAQIFVNPLGFGGAADAIIGSNLFSQTSLLFNGPTNRLGIGIREAVSVPEPTTWLLLMTGLLTLSLRRRATAR
jgi:hypothetical protein